MNARSCEKQTVKGSETTIMKEILLSTRETEAQRGEWLIFLVDLIVEFRQGCKFYLYP